MSLFVPFFTVVNRTPIPESSEQAAARLARRDMARLVLDSLPPEELESLIAEYSEGGERDE